MKSIAFLYFIFLIKSSVNYSHANTSDKRGAGNMFITTWDCTSNINLKNVKNNDPKYSRCLLIGIVNMMSVFRVSMSV